MQNRVSAQRFRLKRKNEFEQLKDDLMESQAQNEQLRQQVSVIHIESPHLADILHRGRRRYVAIFRLRNF